MATFQFPQFPDQQVPVNTFGPSTTPVANNINDAVYEWDGYKWVSVQSLVQKAGDHMTGNLTLGDDESDPAITLNADGSSNFKGYLTVDNYIKVGTRASSDAGAQGIGLWSGDDNLYKRSSIDFYSNQLTGPVLSVVSAPDENTTKVVTSQILTDGMFKNGPDVASGFTTTNMIDPVDGIKIGGAMPDAPNIQLSPGGSARFSGNVETGSGFSADDGSCSLFVNSVGTAESRATIIAKAKSTLTNNSSAFEVRVGSDKRAVINYDGSSEFSGALTVSGLEPPLAGNPNSEGCFLWIGGAYTAVQRYTQSGSSYYKGAQMAADGSSKTKFKVDTSGTLSVGWDVENPSYGTPEIVLSYTGVIDAKNYIRSNTYLWANASGNYAGIYNYKSTSTNLKSYDQKDENSNTNIWFNWDGSGVFKGGVSQSNSYILLQGNDNSKYTVTTDDDGNTTEVYNGDVLDLKEVGLALIALKAAAANATDFTSLKSAIATSLANL